jgi:hypothetical protein
MASPHSTIDLPLSLSIPQAKANSPLLCLFQLIANNEKIISRLGNNFFRKIVAIIQEHIGTNICGFGIKKQDINGRLDPRALSCPVGVLRGSRSRSGSNTNVEIYRKAFRP